MAKTNQLLRTSSAVTFANNVSTANAIYCNVYLSLLGGPRSSKQIHHCQLPCNFEVCSFYFRFQEEPSSLSPLYLFIAAFRHPISLKLCHNHIFGLSTTALLLWGQPVHLGCFHRQGDGCFVDLRENIEKTNFSWMFHF